VNHPNPTPIGEHDELHRRLTTDLRTTAGQAISSPDARRRIDRRVEAHRRRSTVVRAVAAVAVTTFGATGVLVARRHEAPTAVQTGVTPASVPAPGTRPRPTVPSDAEVSGGFDPDRFLPSYIPLGYRFTDGSLEKTPVREPAPRLTQVFRPPGPLGTGPVISLFLGDPAVYPDPPPDDVPALTTGPWSVKVKRIRDSEWRAWFDDGPRVVRLWAPIDLSEEDIRAFVGTVRWDAAAGRYTAVGNPRGLVETALDRGRFGPFVVVAHVYLRRSGSADIVIVTRKGWPGDVLELRARIPDERHRPVDINGRPGLLSVSRFDGGADAFVTFLWPDGSYAEVRSAFATPEGMGDRVSDDELLAVARSLPSVDESSWSGTPG
jgi:hypothetical protein